MMEEANSIIINCEEVFQMTQYTPGTKIVKKFLKI
jgi:hypothetical protein